MKKRILVTGGNGLIGSYFIRQFKEKFKKSLIIYPSHKQMDITNIDSIKKYFKKHKPEIVIHFAAFRDATKAEKQRGNKKGNVWKTNVDGSHNIAKMSKEHNSYLIHISTDYVFSGHSKNKGPYSESSEHKDKEKYLSWYGITKREAEKRIRENHNKVAIIRICNITRPGNNPQLDYVGKILDLYDKKKIYPMFNNQYVTLTYIPSLVDTIIKLTKIKNVGVFHVSTPDVCTPLQLANYLIERAYGKKNEIEPVSIDSFLRNNIRRYPKFGGLKINATQRKLGIKFATWKKVVDFYLKGL